VSAILPVSHDRNGEHDADRGDRWPVEPLPMATKLLGAVLVAAVGLAAGLLFGVGRSLLDRDAVMVLAVAVGVGAAVLAATRFWAMVVVMFVARASLDAFKLDDYTKGANALDPGVVVGLVFVAAAAAWLLAQWRSGELRRPSAPAAWFVGLASAATLSALASGSVSSLGVSLKVWAGALMLVVLEQAYRQRPERVTVVLAAGAASLVVPALVGFWQLSQPRELEKFLEVSRINGTFVHANPYATYLVVVAVMALALLPHLRGPAKAAAALALVAASVLTLFTYARGGWIALVLGVLVVGSYQDRRLVAAVVAVSTAAFVFVPSVATRLSDLTDTTEIVNGNANSLSWRIGYWERLLPLAKENPLTGIGLDQVMVRSPERLMPHNSYIQALVEMGLFGIVALAGLVLSTVVAVRTVVRRTAPGPTRAVAVGTAAIGVGWLVQMASENLLTQAAIFWYLAGPVAYVLAVRDRLPAGDARTDDDEHDGDGRDGADPSADEHDDPLAGTAAFAAAPTAGATTG
jgi:putative inorganic carbon (HCO3(-)) transporter